MTRSDGQQIQQQFQQSLGQRNVNVHRQYKMSQEGSRIQIVQRSSCCFFNIVETSDQRIILARNIFRGRTQESQELFKGLAFLYLEHEKEAMQIFRTCRINPSFDPDIILREDLEYIVPQLLSYFSMHNEFASKELFQLISTSTVRDFYFAHLCYFYLKSLAIVHTQKGVSEIMPIAQYIDRKFVGPLSAHYAGKTLLSTLIVKEVTFLEYKQEFSRQDTETAIKYGTNDPSFKFKQVSNFKLQKYCDNSFLQTPRFFQDLVDICSFISYQADKKEALRQKLVELNGNLPAGVYIPFFRDSIRNYCVLKASTKNIRVFQTKERAPFSFCVQICRPQQLFFQQKSDSSFVQKKSIEPRKYTNSMLLPPQRNPFIKFDYKVSQPIKCGLEEERERPNLHSKSLANQESKEHRTSLLADDQLNDLQFQRLKQNVSFLYQEPEQKSQKQEADDWIFGQPSQRLSQQIRKNSVFGHLQSWRLVHLFVKTGDNLKQEQFAMQLISLFAQIFQEQKLPLHLRPYEVLSVGPDSGVIQMIQDVTTIDSLKRKLSGRGISLAQFFKQYFGQEFRAAKRNFRSSLAAYSLVTYFLQVKDRHNGNILLTRDGHIIHIDFGFLLSNTPRGRLEADVPFKLMSEYVDVMGGSNNESFRKFRAIFLSGFKAIMKHQQKIVVLVKAMLASHGSSMPCFSGGKKALEELEARLNPRVSGMNLTEHCNNLINSSLDNWRARWYDKYQYHFQGIFY